MTTTAATAREADARNRKAAIIAHTLRAAGSDADLARDMNAEQRLLAASAAGQHAPSDATWAVVVRVLNHLEERAAAQPDPFAGLPGSGR